VRVEQEQPDAVVELAAQRAALVREQPARRVGGGHRVVGPGEHDLVQAAVAQGGGAVAGAHGDRPRGAVAAVAAAVAGGEDEGEDGDAGEEGGGEARDAAELEVVVVLAPDARHPPGERRRAQRPGRGAEQVGGAAGEQRDGDDDADEAHDVRAGP
jgi:hypothetical protein